MLRMWMACFGRVGGGMSALQLTELGRLVHELEPRLLQHFEGGWATDWILKRLIDQRVADVKRGTKRKAEAKADGKQQKGNPTLTVKASALNVYVRWYASYVSILPISNSNF